MLNAEELIIAGNGAIHVAPVGTALPTHEGSSLDAAFAHLGYTTEDGVKFTDGKEVGEVKAWQSFYPIRRFIVARSGLAEFTLQQWNRDTVNLAFGGGEWTDVVGGHHVYTPPDPETVDERSFVIDAADGDEDWRIVIERGLVISDVESSFTRTGPALMPITVGITGTDDAAPWYLATDADAAAPAS